MISQEERISIIKSKFKVYKDYPKKGVDFQDIWPIFADPETLNIFIQGFQHLLKDVQYDKILGLESRGLVIGIALAMKLKKPFIPIRKKGKLPGDVLQISYNLQYGQDTIQIQKQAVKPGQRVVIIDDILATGGTANAAIKMMQTLNIDIASVIFAAQIAPLKGIDKLTISKQKIKILL